MSHLGMSQAQPQLHHFKNACHTGALSTGRPLFPSSLRTARPPAKEVVEGWGVTVDDEGHLLLAEWRNSRVEGKYFLFKPEGGGEGAVPGGACMYGQMRNGLLEGDNYIYSLNGTLARCNFAGDRPCSDAYVVRDCRLLAPDSETYDCEVIRLEKLNSQSTLKLELPAKQQNSTVAATSHFEPPIPFLEKLAGKAQREQKASQALSFTKIAVNEHEVFVGFARVAQQKEGKPRRGREEVSGFGVVLRDGWPARYGSFQNGQLFGLGRVYETQMNVCDGYFQGDKMIQGFIIDYYNSRVSFGRSQQDSFEVQGQGDCQLLFEVGLYRRAHHLRALTFINGYLAMPQLLQRSPWPFSVSNRLQRSSSAISSLIQSYRPQINTMDLSSIERVAQSSENRVERQIVDELKGQKSRIRMGIQRELREREREGSRSQEREKEGRRSQEMYREGSRSKERSGVRESRDQRSRQDSHTGQETTRTPERRQRKSTNRIPTISQQSPQKQNPAMPSRQLTFQSPSKIQKGPKLKDLISQYQQCETERKNTLDSSRKADGRSTNRQSGKIAMRPKRKAVDLHRIYSQYLQS